MDFTSQQRLSTHECQAEIPLAIIPIKAKLPCNPPPQPSTPPAAPSSIRPPPLRYPDTLGTLIEVRESPNKGLGVFALHDLSPGTIILSEAPLVTLQDTGSRADPLDAAVASLSPEQHASFLSLSYYTRNPNESRNRSIVYSNGYSIMNDLATGLFESASRINHSCMPNLGYVWKESIGRMVFYVTAKAGVRAGEECMVDYGHKREYLKKIYGFDCNCRACTEAESWSGGASGSDIQVENMGTEERV